MNMISMKTAYYDIDMEVTHLLHIFDNSFYNLKSFQVIDVDPTW